MTVLGAVTTLPRETLLELLAALSAGAPSPALATGHCLMVPSPGKLPGAGPLRQSTALVSGYRLSDLTHEKKPPLWRSGPSSSRDLPEGSA